MKYLFLIMIFSSLAFTQILDNSYYPINEDILYIYDSNIGESEFKFDILGKDNFKVGYYSTGVEYTQEMKSDSSGIYFTKTSNEILFFGNEITYEEPVLRLPFGKGIGFKWNWKGLEFSDDESNVMTLNGIISHSETITIAGVEYDCIVVITETESIGGSKSRLTEWYAKNIGLIKSVAEIGGEGLSATVRKLLGLNKLYLELISSKR